MSNEIGKKIKQLRLSKSLSQQELADKVNITRSTISNYEIGRRTPHLKDLQKFKVDRFARSVKDYFAQESTLEEYGVKLIVVSMPFLQEADIVVKALYVAMAEQFSKNLSDDVGVKMKTFAKKGAFLGGKPPYGFRVVKDEDKTTLEIDEEKAIAIRLLYTKYLEGYGYIQLSRILAEHGFLNPKNEPFTATHIRKMLTSKKYNGWYVWGIREQVKGKERPTYMVCQNCGRAVVGYSTIKPERNNKEYIYYRCNGRKVNGCKLPAVNAVILENYVAEKIKSLVFDDDFVSQITEEIELHLSGDVASFRHIEKKLRDELASVNSQLKESTKDKYARKISAELYEEIVAELNTEKDSLEARLSNIMQQIYAKDKTRDIKAYIARLKNNLESEDADVKNMILNEVVHSILVYDDKIEIYIHLTAPNPTRKLYKGVTEVNNGALMFTLDACQSNVHRGVPMDTIDRQPDIFSGNGLTLLKYIIFDIKTFNKG